MKIKITADSTCDLSPELIKRYDVGILPLTVVMDGKTYLDGVDIVPQDIFDTVARTKVLPKTSAASPEEYREFFKAQLESYDYVIHYNITSKASTSYNSAKAASEEEELAGKVFVIDSLALSTGQGLLVLKACDLAAEGKTPQEIVEITEGLRAKVNTSFVPDSLDYLHKGGRCSLASMIGAKILKLHPLIEIADGQMFAKRKLQGSMTACFNRYITELSAQYPSYDKTRCFITHTHCDRELVEKVRKQIEELFEFDEILETFAGSVVTSHCGKGTLGLLFIAN